MEEQHDTPGALEEARARLYSPRAVEEQLRRAISPEGVAAVPHAWGAKIAPRAHPHVRLALVFFLSALAFAIVAGGIAALILFTGSTSVSTDNIVLATQGPTTIAAGDTVPISLAITNKNVVALQNAQLTITFPPGTKDATDDTKDYPRYTEDLGTISPGATVLRSVKAVVFGGAGSALSIPIALSYESTGSNSTFVKKAVYPLSVTSAPLSISVEAPANTVTGKPVTVKVTVRSNASGTIEGVTLGAAFPFGFALSSASVDGGNGSYPIGTLAPGASKEVTFTGVLAGQAGDQRNFHFTIGTGTGASGGPALTYMTQDSTVAIAAPFLATSVSINGSSASSPVLTPGANNTVTLSWTNSLTVPVSNATISVALAGAVVPGSVRASGGFYDSNANTITFDQSTDPSLSSLAPGASGIGTFSFQTAAAGASKSKTVTLTISIAGERQGESNVPQEISASSVTTATVAGAVALTAQTLHSSGPIGNSGPIPPVVGTATTYTVLWKLTNPGNDITNDIVSATLPSYVTYTGTVSPSGAALSYNSATRTLTWRPGDLASGQTTTAAFQLSFTPSSSQHATAPSLTSTASFTGFDRYAQVPLSASAPAVTTENTGDAGYSPSMSNVQ